MPRKYAVAELPDDQLKFVIDHILSGETNLDISLAFEAEFKTKLAKSSLHRWRQAAGEQLVEKYRLARYQAKQLLEDLKAEHGDKYKIVIDNIEDRLLTATGEVMKQDPLKLLLIQQEEKRRGLKERELELKREHLDLEREKFRGAALDRVKLGQEYSADLLAFIGTDPDGLRWFQRNVKKFDEFLKEKYGE